MTHDINLNGIYFPFLFVSDIGATLRTCQESQCTYAGFFLVVDLELGKYWHTVTVDLAWGGFVNKCILCKAMQCLVLC